jgi:chromosome partitioning protein
VSKPSSGSLSPTARSAVSGGVSAATAPPPPTGKAPEERIPTPPETPGVARIVAIANQKGGVGKSTTAVSLGAALAELGYRVLVIDMDPQGNASTGMGIRHEAREASVYDVIVAEAPVRDAIVHTPIEGLHAIPSTIDLAGAEIELVSQFSRETRLKKALGPVREGSYDFVLLDCPPSLGLLTVNALTAAEELIVPIQCEYYALEGLGQLLRNVNLVQQNINPGLRLTGIVMTMFDPRTKLSEQVVEEVQRFFGDLVYDVIIPRTVRLSEAPGYGQPITVYDPRSKGAETYRELAREVALRPVPDSPMPSFDHLPTVVMPAVTDDAVTREPPPGETFDALPTVHGLVEEAEANGTVGEEAPVQPSIEASTPRVEDPGVRPTQAEAPAATRPPDDPPEPSSEGRHAATAPPAEEVVEANAPPAGRHAAPPTDEELWDEPEVEPRVRPVRTVTPPGQLPERRVVVIDEDADIDIRASQEPLVQHPGASLPAEEQAEIGATLRDPNKRRKRRWRLFRKGGDE